MRIIKTVVAAVLLVGFASSVFAEPSLASGRRVNAAKDDTACTYEDGQKICF
ncbi:hypothetical protein RJO15_20220 [Herbaspirillum huttiense F1]|uniref:hypothetical protein n=1 Tax=Herbaspirillum huttiense TaxID=863372 RepID=UPI0028875588|nr:hypothetical protein [Herbaspirillum huttiense]MDT0358125.1 hypothetical protein [Herbaspirillum huttiense F1]